VSGWIKFEKDLANDPRVLRMASRLCHGDVTLMSRTRATVLGCLALFWSFADTHITQDDTIECTVDEVNEVVGVPGFCEIMPRDWLHVLDANRLHLPDFLLHNGIEAKKRAVDQKRQQRHRVSRHASVTPTSRRHRDQTKTKTETKKEEIPLPLLHESLPRKEWDEWLVWRKTKRMPCDEVTLKKQLKILAPLSTEVQIETIERSIQANWQGLFPQKSNGNGHSNGHDTGPKDDAAARWKALITAEGRTDDPRVRKALEAIGGYSRIRMRTTFESPKIEREFCEAYRDAAA